MGDLDNYFAATSATAAGRLAQKKANEGYELGMQDFLNLMVTELKSQSIDNTADTSEMLNQMVMMQMVSALTNMTEASVMSYAASLVGKTVTVGQYNADGQLQEIVGTVTGTGTMGGDQVVFVNDKYYRLNEIMAVGTLPQTKTPEQPEGTEQSESIEQQEHSNSTEDTQQTEDAGAAEHLEQSPAAGEEEPSEDREDPADTALQNVLSTLD